MPLLAESFLTRTVGAASTFGALYDVVLTEARRLSGADGATVVLREGELCFCAAEDAIGPLWMGQRFPIAECISGWAMQHARSAEISDVFTDERIPAAAYRPSFVQSLVMVPMRSDDPVGAVGVYWRDVGHHLGADALAALQALADECGRAVRRLGVASAPWAPNFGLASPA